MTIIAKKLVFANKEALLDDVGNGYQGILPKMQSHIDNCNRKPSTPKLFVPNNLLSSDEEDDNNVEDPILKKKRKLSLL